MKKINSKAKGRRREWELKNLLNRLLGTNARRGKQYCGEEGNADVVGIPGIYTESKGREYTNLYTALEKAETERAEEERSVIFHKRNRKPWLVTCYLEDLPDVAKAIMETQGGKGCQEENT